MSAKSVLQTTLALALIMCGCGPKVKDLSVDKDFEEAALTGSTLLVGGLTSSFAGPAADSMLGSGALWLRDGLVEHLSGVNVPPLETVPEALGEENQQQMLEEFRKSLTVSAKQLELLGPSATGGKPYLVLARLESDRQWTNQKENKDSSGTVLSRSYNSNRQLLATFSIWDIMTRARVWSGQVAGKSTATNTIKEDELGLGAVGEVIDILTGSESDAPKEGFPSTPGLNEVTSILFENFAKALPRK